MAVTVVGFTLGTDFGLGTQADGRFSGGELARSALWGAVPCTGGVGSRIRVAPLHPRCERGRTRAVDGALDGGEPGHLLARVHRVARDRIVRRRRPHGDRSRDRNECCWGGDVVRHPSTARRRVGGPGIAVSSPRHAGGARCRPVISPDNRGDSRPLSVRSNGSGWHRLPARRSDGSAAPGADGGVPSDVRV